MHHQIRAADRVLIVASPQYRICAEGAAPPRVGRGVEWEARLLREEFYADDVAARARILPVLLPGHDHTKPPVWLGTRYTVSDFTVAGAEALIRYLTGQPYEAEPGLGQVPDLGPRTAGGAGRAAARRPGRVVRQAVRCRLPSVSATRWAVDAVIVLGAVVGAAAGRPRPPDRVAPRDPLPWLAAVTGLIAVNQVLMNVYILRVHGGDPGFVTRHLPAGYFDLADGPALRALAAHWPAPELLAPTVLHVQALFELPFVMLTYLSVMRWLAPGRFGRLATGVPLWAMSVSWSLTFGLVEWALRNPWTGWDLVLRAATAVLTPLLVGRWAAAGAARDAAAASRTGDLNADADAAPSPVQLLLGLVSTGALAVLVLAAYDSLLLYNLGRVRTVLPTAALGHGAAGLLTVFAVPALPIRYGLGPGFGDWPVAAAAGAALLGLATGNAMIRAWQRTAVGLALFHGVGAIVVMAFGLAVAMLAARIGRYPEIGLLAGAAAAASGLVGWSVLVDKLVDRRRLGRPAPAQPAARRS